MSKPTPTTAGEYVGGELELFQHATTWKRYFARQIQPHLRGRVLEVGAGLGGTTEVLSAGHDQPWTCLEPDPRLARDLRIRLESMRGPGFIIREGTLRNLDADEQFDSILYIDVLEHIDDDRDELARAARHLAEGGKVILLSPAYQWLYSPFDQSIGHHRRYSRRTLREAVPPSLRWQHSRYLDSVGVMVSAANRVLLRQGLPTPAQIRFWDRCLVPLSKLVDPLIFYSFGKSLLAVLERGN